MFFFFYFLKMFKKGIRIKSTVTRVEKLERSKLTKPVFNSTNMNRIKINNIQLFNLMKLEKKIQTTSNLVRSIKRKL